MDPAERIADYLSDDLTPDERAAFEAALAGDAALRTQLEAARHADAALARVTRTELPDGFADRLRTALDAELADVLAPTTAAVVDPRVAAQAELGRHDDLAARRAERETPRWVAWAGAAAAAALVVVAGVAGLSSLGSGADEATETMAGPADDSAGGEAATEEGADLDRSMDAPEADDGQAAPEALSEEAEEEEEAAADEGARRPVSETAPLLLADGRALADDQLGDVLFAFEVQELASERLDADAGSRLAEDWRDILTNADAEPDADPDAGARTIGPVADEDRRAVAACVAEALDGRDDAIPAYAEVADFEGQAAIVLGLVALDPETATFSRPEALALDRDTCEVLAGRP